MIKRLTPLLRRFVRKYPMILSVTVMAAFLILNQMSHKRDEVLKGILFEVAVSCLIYIILRKVYAIDPLDFSIRRFLTALRMFWPGFLPMFVLMCGIYRCFHYAWNPNMVTELLINLVLYLVVGICEEFLFRGILADGIFLQFRNRKHALMISMIVSSFIFGFGHVIYIIDFTNPPNLYFCIMRTLDCAMVGALLLLIYWKTQSLLCPALCHFLYDFYIDIFPALYLVPEEFTNTGVYELDRLTFVCYSTSILATAVTMLYFGKKITSRDYQAYRDRFRQETE